MFNHSVSALVSSLKNGVIAKRSSICIAKSNIVESILSVLKDNGYILNYTKNSDDRFFSVYLKYYLNSPVIRDIKVISKPGRRVYCGANDLPVVYDGLGLIILSTSKGVICSVESKNLKVGGELLLKVF